MSAFELGMRLARADAAIRRWFEAGGLSLHDLAVLHHLLHTPDRCLRRVDLADRLGMTPSGIARLLAPLEKLGFVAREPDPRDARLALVTLTDAGAARTEEALEIVEERASAMFARALDDEQQRTLTDLLARLAPPA